MKPTRESIFAEAMRLPPPERAALVEQLLDALGGFISPEVAAAWDAEILRRVRELDDGTIETVPWEQVRDELRGVLDRGER